MIPTPTILGPVFPTLALQFAGRDTLDSRVTFARSEVATYFDNAGVLQTAASGVARIKAHTFDGTVWNNRGLLIEEERTNLALHSESFSAPWVNSGTPGLFSNNSVAPDGTVSMDRVTDEATGSFPGKQQPITIPTTNLPYTYSLFVQKFVQSTLPEFQLDMTGGARTRGAVQLNLQTGAPFIRNLNGTPGTTSVVQELDNHWRVSLTANNTGNNTILTIRVNAAMTKTPGIQEASALGGVNVWGHQLEQASEASSYIKTTTAAVTRTADVATVSNLSWFNQSAGTFYIEGSFPYASASVNAFITLNDGTSGNRLVFKRDASGNINFQSSHSADTDGASNGAAVIVAGTKFKVAGAYSDDDLRAAVDGVLSPADAAAAFPLANGMTTLNFGDGHIARIIYWPTRLPDALLQSLTG